MAIHDADVRGTDRNSPMPNSHDLQGLARMAAGTNSVNYVSGGTNLSPLQFTQNGILEVVYSGTTTLSSTGETTNNTQDVGYGGFSATINHNLGYIPTVIASVNIGGTAVRQLPALQMFSTASTSTLNNFIIDVVQVSFVDETSVTFEEIILQTSTSSYTPSDGVLGNPKTIQYYLCRQVAG